MSNRVIKTVCIFLLVLLIFYSIFYYPKKISSIIISYDNISMMRIAQDGTYKTISISELCENNLINMIDELWCRKSNRNTRFLATGDLCMLYGQWCFVFTEKESYLYSVSKDDYYEIIGNPKDLYRNVKSIIR